ncbi:MAG TPA: hypothetical protein VF403_16085, partial [Kofleriaceae bacterium]
VAQLTKFTLVIQFPLVAVLALACRRGSLRHVVVAGVLGVVVLNAGYGCRGVGAPIGDLTYVSESFTGIARSDAERDLASHLIHPGNRFTASMLGRLPSPLPTEYLKGIDLQRRDFEKGLRCYLRGEWQVGGWWYYYLYALGVKLTLGLLVAIALGVGLSLRRRDPVVWRDRLAVALPGVAVLAFVSSQTGFTQHVRYVLPALPFAIILASRCVELAHRRLGAIVVACVLGGAIASSLAAQPRALGYFNELVDRGEDHLLDSNLDWGQDLIELRIWLAAHPQSGPLRLAYFGAIDPAVYGIAYTLPAPALPAPGTYAISANYVHGLRFRAFDGAGHVVVIESDAYAAFRHLTPRARVGSAILIFDVP